MSEVFLISPDDADASAFPALLAAALARTSVPVLLLTRGGRDEAAYRALVGAATPVAQAAGTAVLIEGALADVRALGADGLHVDGPESAVKAAVAALKPALIVGAGRIGSRHDAMAKGELGLDYVMFGPLSGPISDAAREMAAWWAETMEVPCVLSDPEAGLDALVPVGCEFVAVRDAVWGADDPVAALTAAAARLAE